MVYQAASHFLSVLGIQSQTPYASTACLCVAAALFLASPVYGRGGSEQAPLPPVAPVALAASDAADRSRDFFARLRDVATRAGITVVVEGEPASDSSDLRLVESLRSQSTTSAVQKLGDAYDFDLERVAGSVYVLKKRYTSPEDLPDITLPESALVVNDLLRLLAPFAASTGTNGRLLKPFEESLTPDQITALADKQSGLPVSSLGPEQKALLWKLPLSLFDGKPESKMQYVKAQIDCVSGDGCIVGWGVSRLEQAGRLFGYSGTLKLPQVILSKYFRPLSNPAFVSGMTNGSVGILPGGTAAGPDPTSRPSRSQQKQQ